MRTTLICAVAMIALTGPVLAQQKNVPKYGETDKDKTRSEKEEEKATDRAYKNSLDRIPAKPDVDPWGNARSAEKSAAKPSSAKSDVPKPKPNRPAPN